MQTSTLFLRAFSLTAALAFSAGAGAEGPMKPSRAAQAVMSDDVKDFFETAASSNMFEIESGKLAAKRAADPALKEFAMMMVEDHGKAGDELKQLAQKKGVTLPTQLLKRHQAMLDDLKNEKAGEPFDDEYRDKMVLSHKEAVTLFDKTAKDAKDPDVKAFAAKTLPTLQKHGGHAKELPEN